MTGQRVSRVAAGARQGRVWRALAALILACLIAREASGQDAANMLVLSPVEVVGSTPLLGSGVDRQKVPAETHVLTSGDVTREGPPSALRALEENIGGVTLDEAAGNPFQPSLFYHGFQASPLQGNAEGLAVYLDGMRFNQPFADTVNWDLIPDRAIDRMNLEGANSVFGLNALGGSLSLQLKNGFTYHGGEFDLFGGSFGRVGSNLQYGVQSGNTSAYIAGSVQHEDGWRQAQSSDLYNIFGDIGWRGDRGEVHLGIAAANTDLNGPGTSPVDLLAVSRSARFTSPNLIANKFGLVMLSGTYDITDTTSLQGLAYYDYFLQRVINGNVPDITPCNDGSGLLCESPGVYATDRNGNPIPDFLNGGPYSELDQQTTNTNGYGASLQVTNHDAVFGLPNRVTAGFSFDGANTLFSANSSIGGLNPLDSVFTGPGIVIDQADGSIAPVRAGIATNYYGVYFSDTFNPLPDLALNVSGRFNAAEIDLKDEIGTPLTGQHTYNRFNPGVGATYKLAPWISVYASYSEANRAPTAAELSCASAASPCSLANFFVGDPDLKQVVSHSVEAGVRGRFSQVAGGHLDWNLGLFHTDLDDDILFVNSPIQGRAYFQNAGATRRQGVDAGLRWEAPRWLAYIDYSYTDATFQTPLSLSSENNPLADANGTIQVHPGDRLPGVPAQLVKLGVQWKVTDAWTVGATGIIASGQYLFGDEANLTKKLPAYFVLNLNTNYQLTRNVQVYGLIENALNEKYYTYGTFSPTTAVPIAQAPNASNPRSYSPAAPFGGYGGVRVTF